MNAPRDDTNADQSGAVYVFTRSGVTWSQQAYVKASNARSGATFGTSVALWGDTLAVGASFESGRAIGVNGDQGALGSMQSGAAYVFTRRASTWSQQAYVKASNTASSAYFGHAVSVSGDTLAVGAIGEASGAIGTNGSQTDLSAPGSGAAYVLR